MPIVGFNFKKLHAEKKNLIKENTKIKIDSKIGITNLDFEKLPTGSKKSDGLRIDFEFLLNYQPDIADIAIEGFIYYLDDLPKIKEIEKTWKDKKDIPVEVKQQILNSVILKATIKALALEQEINVPPHMPFPSIQPASKKKNPAAG